MFQVSVPPSPTDVVVDDGEAVAALGINSTTSTLKLEDVTMSKNGSIAMDTVDSISKVERVDPEKRTHGRENEPPSYNFQRVRQHTKHANNFFLQPFL